MFGMVVLVVVWGSCSCLGAELSAARSCGRGGTAAILRDIPAVGGHGWRHGVIRYRGGEAVFYRLSSLRLVAGSTAESTGHRDRGAACAAR